MAQLLIFRLGEEVYGLEISAIQEILEAISVLEHNPLIGRPVEDEAREAGTRELVIGRRMRGHVALYRYVPELDIVFVLALRSQREAGYAREGGDES